jgi:uridine kinase
VKPLIIGIAGGTGSGKSTVAQNVAQALSPASVAFIDMDGHYRDFSRYADVIVPRGEHNRVAIDMIVAKIERRLATDRARDGRAAIPPGRER